MSNRITYSCTALMGTNKTGILKPDTEGYYPLVLGALNVFNSAGAYYPLGPAKEVFEESGALMRRIRSGCLKGENGHPKRRPGMTDREYLERILTIEETNVCSFFKEVTIVDGVKDPQGNSVVAVIGQTKPSGVAGPALKESLEDKNQNVCFSVRSITDDEVVGGRRIKNLRLIVTWDWVTEPGIAAANKFSAPTLEHLTELTFNLDQVRAIESKYKNSPLGLESSPLVVSALDIEEAMGWKHGSIGAKRRVNNW